MAKKGKKNKPTFYESKMDSVHEELDFLDEYGSRSDIPRLELEIGETEVRVLPAWSDRGKWFQRYGMHWNLPIPGERTTFKCAQMQESPQECLFCEGAEMYRDSNPDLYNKWRAKPRYDFNVIKVDAPEEGVMIMSLPPTAAEQILAAADKYGDPTHPEKGYNFTITKKKTGSKAYDIEYQVWPDRSNSELEDWDALENLILLDEVFPAPSFSEQQAFLQVDAAATGDQKLISGAEDVLDELEEDDDDEVQEADIVEDDDDDDEEEGETLSVREMLRRKIEEKS